MNETPARSSEAPHGGGYRPGGGGECAPLQTRAAFLANWDWQSVVGINQRACARGEAQHGLNPQAEAAGEGRWTETHRRELTLGETFDFLRACHRGAPFLFFNGNTFSFIGRELALALFSDLPPVRRREVASTIAHYIAGVLDREAMAQVVEALCEAAAFAPGDRVRTLKGSLRGEIIAILDDGRVKWKCESGSVLIALPESLVRDE